MNLSKIDMFQTKFSQRNTRNELFNTYYKFEIANRSLFMHTNLNTLILPFILLSELLGRNETDSDEKLFAIRKLIIVSYDVLVYLNVHVCFLKVCQFHDLSLY